MPKILPITVYPDKLLRKKSIPVQFEPQRKKAREKLCADMAATMLAKDGVGLAAPQIGLSIRLIVINTKDGVRYLFNPEISKKSLGREWGEEGCLSVPNVFGQVKRAKSISFSFADDNGGRHQEEASGFMARVIQHEIDHLDGILFIDQAKELKEMVRN
ncbi:peptide deformylase [Candidatus Falkowbacteria bacterium CG_4_10_14_0_2_um_filter_48_10]|uniref:Peptide deformylase n=1 Tax=Candidatus Falkowbacteria bacterium CG23_combo_of_CG06-09_8_20_14_all_49_15 TaxID=1974572 RepID=A0A2G9ZMA3_9BACT|nr:MAG: peptide deformylase [Candidatus Falkowbacteria bacterium CG23_combo_of_CG06-09_8_20_14_all_49_15]PJA07562.1 MAG: peptide deformylase [Candidatus Falkowbacteria bacterium CG_4_10_14_0_2_um_filter_48_10]